MDRLPAALVATFQGMLRSPCFGVASNLRPTCCIGFTASACETSLPPPTEVGLLRPEADRDGRRLTGTQPASPLAGGANAAPILNTPLTRATGSPSAVTSPCANTIVRVVRSTCASPCTQAPSGEGAR